MLALVRTSKWSGRSVRANQICIYAVTTARPIRPEALLQAAKKSTVTGAQGSAHHLVQEWGSMARLDLSLDKVLAITCQTYNPDVPPCSCLGNTHGSTNDGQCLSCMMAPERGNSYADSLPREVPALPTHSGKCCGQPQ
jgi:hypothetical protein